MGIFGEVVWMMEFLGFKIGINGVVIFKKLMLLEILKFVLLECIVLEIDLFYFILVFNCGKRNESVNVKDILIKVVEIYNEDLEKVVELIVVSVLKVFGMFK